MAKTVILLTSGTYFKFDDVPIQVVVDSIEEARKYDSKRAHFHLKNELTEKEDDIYIYVDHVEAIHTED